MSEIVGGLSTVWEAVDPATIVESARVAIVDPRGLVLVVQRALTSGHNPGKWEAPGGQVEPGETYEQAAAREVKQETGILLNPAKFGPPALVDIHPIQRGKHRGKISVTHGFLAYVGMSDVQICQESMDSSWRPHLSLRRSTNTTPVTRALLREFF